MEAIISIFREVRDPRDVNSRHRVTSMLFIALAATLCGAKNAVDIADFGEANAATLGEIVELPHGVPSHDCFSRLFRLLDPAELTTALARFGQALRAALQLGAPRGVVAVDAKSLRRAYERGRAFMPALMVGVWDAETRLSIAARCAEGGDEVAATLAVLKALVLKGCIVTADALHCHPGMAEAVRATGAHYALALKGNHGPLHSAAVAAFAKADAGGKLTVHERRESGHDRSERRRVSVIATPSDAPSFPDLAAFARIEAERISASGKIETATRYFALSKRLAPSRALEVARTHWDIENGLHWQLDVVFNEDDARTRKDYGPQNLAVIRRMALDILRAHPADRSIARKMKLATWSREFFFELFAHMQ
ncbi:MAG TPA: ISAs1 family transposase [Stellaceae bacterium]|nr:ISAs1 family transposase [Stellaceae bacterium]